MAHFRAIVASPAPADRVYDYLADFASIAEWDPNVSAADLVSGTAATAGARYRIVTGSLPLEYEILEAVPPADGFPGRVELEAITGDFRSYDVITVAPTAHGCEVLYDADLALNGLRRLFDPVLRVAFTVLGNRAKRGLTVALQSPPFT